MINMNDIASSWPKCSGTVWEKFLKLSVAEYAFQGFLYLKVALNDVVRRKNLLE